MTGRTNAEKELKFTVDGIANIRLRSFSNNVSRNFSDVPVGTFVHVSAARFNDARSPTISVTGLESLTYDTGTEGSSGWVDAWYLTTSSDVSISVTHPTGNTLLVFIN